MPMNLRACENCGDVIDTNEDMYYSCEGCGDIRCGDCGQCPSCEYDDDYPSRDDRDDRVHPYDYRPRFWNPKGEFPFRPLMGVELEVHNRDISVIPDVVESFDIYADHLFVKEDGSLDSGLEIVSHPATLEWTRTYPWARLLEDLRNNRSSARDGYGLHVHVSRNAFRRQGKRSPTHQLTWLLFLHRNPRQLELLARRADDEWASFRKPARGELAAKAHAHDGYYSNRYVAVNCNNQRTYELRFFKSTLDYGEFMAAIEFADASVEYTRAIKTADVLKGQALTWPHFARWAESRDYPNLSDQIQVQGTEDVTTPLDEVVNRRLEPGQSDPQADCECPSCRSNRRRAADRQRRRVEENLRAQQLHERLLGQRFIDYMTTDDGVDAFLTSDPQGAF